MNTDAQGNPIDTTLPPIVQRFLASGAKLESIRLDEHGHWWHEGGLFNNKKIEALFYRSIDRTPGGTWVLNIAPFTYPITVDDVPLFVEDITMHDGGQRISMHLSDNTTEDLDPASLRYTEDRGFYCTAKEGRFEARLRRAPYYALTEHLEERGDDFGLKLGESFWPLQPRN